MAATLAPTVRTPRGFFIGRRTPDYGVGLAGRSGLIEYANVPPIVGMLVSAGVSTLHEIQTVYGLEDCYTLAEVVLVDSHNRSAEAKRRVNNHR